MFAPPSLFRTFCDQLLPSNPSTHDGRTILMGTPHRLPDYLSFGPLSLQYHTPPTMQICSHGRFLASLFLFATSFPLTNAWSTHLWMTTGLLQPTGRVDHGFETTHALKSSNEIRTRTYHQGLLPRSSHNTTTFAAAIGAILGALLLIALAVAFSLIRRRRRAIARAAASSPDEDAHINRDYDFEADEPYDFDGLGQASRARPRRAPAPTTTTRAGASSAAPPPMRERRVFVPRFFLPPPAPPVPPPYVPEEPALGTEEPPEYIPPPPPFNDVAIAAPLPIAVIGNERQT